MPKFLINKKGELRGILNLICPTPPKGGEVKDYSV